MSLEQALAANTAAVEQLIAVLTKTALVATAPKKKAEVSQATVGTKSEAASSSTENGASSTPGVSTPPSTAEAVAQQPAPVADASVSQASEVSPSAPAAVSVTYDDVKKLVLKHASDKGREPTMAILKQFGVEKATELKQDQFAAVVAAFEKALA